ncbi:aquaporin-7 [Sorex araneus]|uniref:aquaporin-7 n=1 Tax=Sorex araneus TaxID=42254 RepID=UPI0024333B71|nr:aquaporin-7 [Sorex araneus]
MSQRNRSRRSARGGKLGSSPFLQAVQRVFQKKPVREFLAEFLSTYTMMVFGLGSVAHMVLGGSMGSYLGVNLGFGFGVTMGVYIAGGVSGAHMNSAVTFTQCALGRMSWKKFPIYVSGQFLGAFMAAATIYGLFWTAIAEYSGPHLTVTGPQATASIFATYLPDRMSLWRGFIDEMVLTGLLQMCILAIGDKNNSPAPEGTQALLIGILVVILGVSLGMNTGYAINPARDLAPRFFTFIAGWGKEVFSARNWWWVPVVAPPLGAYLGAITYLAFIGLWIPQNPKNNNLGSTENKTPNLASPSSRSRESEQFQDSIHLERF